MKPTQEHIKLLQAMASSYLSLDCEYKAVPAFDSKRPYGNRYFLNDIGEILDIPFDDLELERYSESNLTRFKVLQEELPEVLKHIILNYQVM